MVKAIDILKNNQVKTPGNKQMLKDVEFLRKNQDWLPYSTAIAIRVLHRMKALGVTQKQLAESLGCTQQYISVLLKGRENLTLETIAKLEKALHFDLIRSLVCLVDGYQAEPERPARYYLNSPKESED